VTSSWTNVRFDHNAVTGSCASCHNGSTATGKGALHITTTAECDNCHTTLAWTPANFDHNNVTGSCSSCHNGATATGKPSNHFTTTLQCDECHRTTAWLLVTYSHTSAAFPGNHGAGVGCTDCHTTNAQTIAWQFGAYQPDCAACHADDFKPDPHKKNENPDARYTLSELRDCSGSCHIYTDSSLTTIKERRNSEHRTTDRGFD